MNPLAMLRDRLRRDTGGLAVTALVVLCLLYFFDEFDTAAFGVLAPNIEKAFHLTDQRFVGLVTANVTLVVILAVPVGYLGDRVRRTPLVVLSGLLAGTFSFLTGMVGTVGLLLLVRLGNGLGLVANGPIHNSLLSDYYRPEDRAKVFGDHINAMYLGAILGPGIAGVIATAAGWRAAFMVLIVPIVAVAAWATKLREPVRGETDDAGSALAVTAEDPVPFSEAYRILWATRTLRRQYIGQLFFGAGLIPLAAYLPLYLQRTYHITPLGRGLVGSVNAAVTFIGVTVGSRMSVRWFAKGAGEPLRRASYWLAAVGVGLFLLAVSPVLPLSLVVGAATSFAVGMFQPPFYAVQSLVSPARVRTLSFSFGAVFLSLGVICLFFLPGFSKISDTHGIRAGIAVLTPYWLITAAILYSAARFVADDVNRAMRTLATAAELRRQRLEAGDRSLLLCSGVDVSYGQVQVLFGVDLEVLEGEMIALLGTNGAGKSTLLKAISGLVDPTGGAVFFDGEDITHADARKAAQRGIVQMPGGRSIFPTLTVGESLRLAGWMYKRRDPAHVREATAKVLEYFPVLAERRDQLAGNLSGGEQQMLGLGMAFIAKPRLLLIDELSLGLAPAIVGRLVDIVRAIHAQGTTVVVVEQSVNVALTLAQRAVFMEKGEVRFSGPTSELLGRADILRSVFLEGAAGVIAPQAAAPRTPARARARVKEAEAQPTVLAVADLTRSFGGIRAVNGVSFELRRREILGLIGQNGAGKTTIFDLVSGFIAPDSGTVTLGGLDVTSWSPERRAWAGLGRSFQDARLFPSLTVVENLSLAFERHLDLRDPLASALCLPAVGEDEEHTAERVDELIELFGLGAFTNKFVSELSTGSRRIVDLAMTVAHRPNVLILDEPSSGIAQRETEALAPLLVRIRDQLDCGVLVIEHDMPLVTGISDRMVALELGRVISEGTPAEVVNDPKVVASYLGEDESVVARSGTLGGTRARSRRRTPAAPRA